jgi:hypothetical protein
MNSSTFSGIATATRFDFFVTSNVYIHHFLSSFSGPSNTTTDFYSVTAGATIALGTQAGIAYSITVSDAGHYSTVNSVIFLIAQVYVNAGIAYYTYDAHSGQAITTDFGIPLAIFGYPFISTNCIFGIYFSQVRYNPTGFTGTSFQWFDPTIRNSISVTSITISFLISDVRMAALCLGLCANA